MFPNDPRPARTNIHTLLNSFVRDVAQYVSTILGFLPPIVHETYKIIAPRS